VTEIKQDVLKRCIVLHKAFRQICIRNQSRCRYFNNFVKEWSEMHLKPKFEENLQLLRSVSCFLTRYTLLCTALKIVKTPCY